MYLQHIKYPLFSCKIFMMKVLMIVCSSPLSDMCAAVTGEVLKKRNIETELFAVNSDAVSGCIGCGKCWKSRKCIFDDGVNRCLPLLSEADALIVLTSSIYGEADPQMCSFLNRLMNCASDALAHKPAMVICQARTANQKRASEMIHSILERADMIILTQQEGCTVRNEENLDPMRSSVDRLGWLMECMEAGRKAGIEDTEKEFVRKLDYVR